MESGKCGPKITPIVPLVKSLAAILAKFRQFNASLDAAGKSITYKKDCHIVIAVDTPSGLLVPVLRDCDLKSPFALADELAAISAKARSRGLSLAETSGGSISILSLGHIGDTAFTPIINAPEAAVLDVTKLQTQAAPGPDGGTIWQQILPVSLSYDHRVVNGAVAARLVVALAEELGAFQFD